ncbi:hypothetical protein ACFV7Q_36570 [Streptomyces sp. NPDC059851]|uniref:hypothetical protein n=1 Tax=Streptomyces sp. NPDC059851 TaxID=3346971 RepID=UPI003648BC53
MNDSTNAATPSDDEQVVERLVPVWLAEAERNGSPTAAEAAKDWRQRHRRLTDDAARELADWVTARVTDTGFNEDEGPSPAGPARISVADKAAVHRWLAAHGHEV